MPQDLQRIVASLETMSHGAVPRELRKELAKAARPFLPRVRAAIMNIPTTGNRHTGLRVRIARSVEAYSHIDFTVVRVGVRVSTQKMPSGQKSLPLMMEGVKLWRHPVFGDDTNWVTQEPHPYFEEGMAGYGAASQMAVGRAMESIARVLNQGRI
jgi:hypothetical protein